MNDDSTMNNVVVVDAAWIPTNRCGLKNTDCSLDPSLRREVNLVVARTLMQLRHESKLQTDATDDDDDDDTQGPEPIILGKKLGEGGFSTVYEVEGNPKLAYKLLSNDTLKDRERLFVAAADIVREGHFMANLCHPNIVTLRGYGPLDDISHYYLLIDKIETPLSDKIDAWGLATVENEQIYDRLVYAMAIAQAMAYLHSRNIVYRDLKIDNIGLDGNGHILLYDFGLAKELKGSHENGKYKLSGNTGSWAYMAPEVAKGYKYNLSVDVYSYGILLWELLSGKYACEGSWNVDKEGRPPFLRTWPQSLETLITDCWHWNPNNRPTFVQIEEQLNTIMLDLRPNHNGNGGSSMFSWIVDETTKMFR